MKKRTAETVTAQNVGVYEKRVWRLACRQRKTLAGGFAGWLAGDVVFLLVFWAATLAADDFVPSAHRPPLSTLSSAWEGLCIAVWPGAAALGEGELAFWSIPAAVLAAAAANLLLGTAVGLCWPGVKFDPLPGEELARAQELYRRCKEAELDTPSRKWYFSLLTAAVYAAAILLTGLLAPGGIPELRELAELEEIGPLMSILGLPIMQGVLMFMFLLCYLPYRGLSGFLRLWLDGLRRRICREYQLSSTLWEYERECQKQAEQRAKDEEARKKAEEEARQAAETERRRQEGDELYRRAISGGRTDAELIQQAAELGCRPACLYMGRQLMDAWINGNYTREEKLEIAGFGRDYFQIAAQEEHFPQSQTEGEFGRLMFEVILAGEAEKPDAGRTVERWNKLLAGLRSVRASGQLDKKYNSLCVSLIDYAEGMAKSAQENWEWETGKRVVLDYSRLFPPSPPVSYWDQLTDYRDVYGRRMTRREVEDLYG